MVEKIVGILAGILLVVAAAHDESPVLSRDGFVCVIFDLVMTMLILSQSMVIRCSYRHTFVVVFCPDDAMTSL